MIRKTKANHHELKMLVWRGRPDWVAISVAHSVSEARALLLEQEDGGDQSTPVRQEAVKRIKETQPEIYTRANAEFVLTDSGELRESDNYSETLKARIACLETDLAHAVQESEVEEKLRERMAKILTDTANELHGGKLNNGLWSWHNLTELAKRQRDALRVARRALLSYQYGNAATELAKECADHLESILREREDDRTK